MSGPAPARAPSGSASVVPLVLAAGASTRMGRPKALLDFGGQSCIELVLAACRDAGLGRAIVVIGPADTPAGAAIREFARVASLPAELVTNERPELGQLSSLQAALARLPADASAFLIFPVDYPLVRAAEVRMLAKAFLDRGSGARVFVPSFARRRGHPVLVDATLAPEFLALPAGGASARAVFQAHRDDSGYVDMPDDRILCDMDTREDYAACLARFRAEPPGVR